MRTKIRAGRTATAAALLLLATACGGKQAMENTPASGPGMENTIPVKIDNNTGYMLDVYATGAGNTTQMIGSVQAGSIATLQIDANTIIAGPIQLIAVELGGRGLARSGPLVLTSASNTIRFDVQPNLSASVATVH